MSYCNAREDAISMALTVVEKLFKRINKKYDIIGRLDVGSESNVDKSKSIKTHLMTLFEKDQNYNVEGVDNINACYGGTASIFNIINWMESSYWDGRLGLVVSTDVAVYKRECSAHATGGAGALAILIGPNGFIKYNSGERVSYMSNVYDFYKPVMYTEYPLFDGKLSIQSYIRCALNCWILLKKKLNNKSFCKVANYIAFHAPYSRLVMKTLSYIYYLDEKINANGYNNNDEHAKNLLLEYEQTWLNIEKTKELEKRMMDELKKCPNYKAYEKSLELSKLCGNTYTNSVTVSLLSTLAK